MSVPEKHVLCQTPSGFRMTAYWQEQCLYMGQQQVFEEASECIEKLTGTGCNGQTDRASVPLLRGVGPRAREPTG